MKYGYPALVLLMFGLTLGSCTDDEIRAIVHINVVALNGNYLELGNAKKECPDANGGKHWGAHYPANHPVSPIQNGKNTVCVSGGLPTHNKHKAAVALHEYAHLYLFRLGQEGKIPVNTHADEEMADCYAVLNGAGANNPGVFYGCPQAKKDQMRAWNQAYRQDGNPWCDSACD